MRQILVDRIRRKRAQKRGGDRRQMDIELSSILLPELERQKQKILDVHEALNELSKDHAMEAKLVELRFFGGLSLADSARALDITEASARSKWEFAKAMIVRSLMP